MPLRALGARVGLPEADAAEIGVAILAQLEAFRQLVELLGVATAHDHVLGDQRTLQLLEDSDDFATSFLVDTVSLTSR